MYPDTNHTNEAIPSKTHVEFFAGIGGVTAGLNSWSTIWANDIDKMKSEYYAKNHGDHIICEDINKLSPSDVPESSLVSATYPCTNTSCAGDRTGLMGIQSGVVYKWVSLVRSKGGASCYPFGMLENPTGLISRGKGKDLRSLIMTLNEMGYSVVLTVVCASHFVPQSRPRIFINCIKKSIAHANLKAISSAADIPQCNKLYPKPLRDWMAKNIDLDICSIGTPALPTRTVQLEDLIDFNAESSDWASQELTEELVANLTGVQRERFDKLVRSPAICVASVARRGRKRADGTSYNATEISTSGLAPAQRPYKGGSSRCWVLVAGKGSYRFKCVSPRESARLMGFDDSFTLPENVKQAYQCTGDSVVPQAVAWVEKHVFAPLLAKTLPVNDEPIKQLELDLAC